MTKWTVYYCENGHRWNQAEDTPRTQVTCSYPMFKRADDMALRMGITVGGTFAVLCPECGSRGTESRHFTGTLGGIRCSHACLEAEGGNCKCSCGGQYHGMEAH